MNQREKEILKEILKDELTISVDPDGTITVCFAGEVVCKSEDNDFNGEVV